MVKEVAGRGADWELHYGGRALASMAFVEELLAAGRVVHLYPQDEVGIMPLDDILSAPQPGVGVYACGPGPMLSALMGITAMWPVGAINMERFTAAPPALVHRGPQSIEVELAIAGLTIEVAADESILEAVERRGISIVSSCRVGTCGTCETQVLDGTPEHHDSVLTAEERAQGDCMMICVSRATTSRLLLEI